MLITIRVGHTRTMRPTLLLRITALARGFNIPQSITHGIHTSPRTQPTPETSLAQAASAIQALDHASTSAQRF